MLTRLFGSRTRVKVLTLLLTDPDKSFFVREITRRLGEKINSVRRELKILEKIGLVNSRTDKRKRYYSVNLDCNYYQELRALILKIGTTPEERLVREISQVGNVQLALLTGVFTKYPHAKTDLLIVGTDIDVKRLEKVVTRLEDDVNEEVDYTVMSVDEFNYRHNLADRFIEDIFQHDYLKIVDKLSKQKRKIQLTPPEDMQNDQSDTKSVKSPKKP